MKPDRAKTLGFSAAAAAVALLVALACWLVHRGRTESSRPKLGHVDRIVVLEPQASPPFKTGPFTVTDPATVARMVELVANSEVDDGLYDLVKLTEVKLYRGKSLRHSIRLGANLFDLDGRQYRERTGELERIIVYMLRSGAPLTGKAETGRPRCRLGEPLTISLVVKNVGEKKLKLQPALRAKVSYLKKEAPGEWSYRPERNFEMTSRSPEGTGGPASLAPGGTLTYVFDLPTDKLEKGGLRLNTEFKESAGAQEIITPGGFKDVPVVVE